MKIEIRKMYDMASLGMGVAGGVLGEVFGQLGDNRQAKQNRKNMKLQIAGSKELTDYNAKKQLEMWEKTGYGAQKDQMMRAGINPALMYGMGGGGGQTASVATGSVGQGGSPSSGGEYGQIMGQVMQLGLMKAQKENIEADTANKRAEATYTGGAKTGQTVADTKVKDVQVPNVKADTEKKKSETWGLDLDNAVKQWMQSTDENGNDVGEELNKSVTGQQRQQELRRTVIENTFKNDENGRQAAMNSAKIAEIMQQVTLMKAKGLTEGQIFRNLQKDGTIKDTEIEWQKIGLSKETLGQVLLGLIKGLK